MSSSHSMWVPSDVWKFFQKHSGSKDPSGPILKVLYQEMTALLKNGARSPELLDLCALVDIDPVVFDPDSRDEEERYNHIKQKKRMIIRGYRCEGMNNPVRTLSYLIRDIQNYISWDDLGPGGQNSFNALVDNYQQWCLTRQTKKEG